MVQTSNTARGLLGHMVMDSMICVCVCDGYISVSYRVFNCILAHFIPLYLTLSFTSFYSFTGIYMFIPLPVFIFYSFFFFILFYLLFFHVQCTGLFLLTHFLYSILFLSTLIYFIYSIVI